MAVDSLDPGAILDVTTLNTRYRVIVLDAEGRAVVTGGPRFREPTEVRIEGSTAGGREFIAGLCMANALVLAIPPTPAPSFETAGKTTLTATARLTTIF